MIVIDSREKFKEEIREKLVKKLPEVPVRIKKVNMAIIIFVGQIKVKFGLNASR